MRMSFYEKFISFKVREFVCQLCATVPDVCELVLDGNLLRDLSLSALVTCDTRMPSLRVSSDRYSEHHLPSQRGRKRH